MRIFINTSEKNILFWMRQPIEDSTHDSQIWCFLNTGVWSWGSWWCKVLECIRRVSLRVKLLGQKEHVNDGGCPQSQCLCFQSPLLYFYKSSGRQGTGTAWFQSCDLLGTLSQNQICWYSRISHLNIQPQLIHSLLNLI